jgi:hypothetical protein
MTQFDGETGGKAVVEGFAKEVEGKTCASKESLPFSMYKLLTSPLQFSLQVRVQKVSEQKQRYPSGPPIQGE